MQFVSTNARREWVAWATILALLFPLAVPLVAANAEVVLGVALDSHKGNEHAGHHDSARDENPGSDVPGAPGHPLDHGCFPCQVLKFLASCLPQFHPELSSPRLHYAVPPKDRTEPQHWGQVVSLPPSRAPPQPA